MSRKKREKAGWKLVPCEPTADMLKASLIAWHAVDISSLQLQPYACEIAIYKAMVAAAPKKGE